MKTGETANFLEILGSGRIEIEGLLPWSSNYAFLVRVCSSDIELPAVYKPSRGERPLWDFPEGTLSFREFAAFLISDAIGWDLVPPTVLRNGEHGLGSIQLFIRHNPEQHYFSIEGQALYRDALQKMALLDVVINNADRKGGHVILEEDTRLDEGPDEQAAMRVWGIDHGICFHAEHKLRTVIWEFAGEAIPNSKLADLQDLTERLNKAEDPLLDQLHQYLNIDELRALRRRLQNLLTSKIFPYPGPGRHYPWPPV